MPKYYIDGGNRLEGEITLQGAKNSALPLLSATLLVRGTTVLRNCPDLSDVRAAISILTYLGCKCCFEGNTVCVDARDVICNTVPEDLMHEMRSSVVFLGAMLSRCARCTITAPGGCELGPRPIDLHLKSIKQMGFSVSERCGSITCEACSGFRDEDITLDFPSVGATENVILASVISERTVTLRNAAKEPEICDLADFLNKAGAKIIGAGTDCIIIHGVEGLHDVEFSVMPDRIAAATYMAAAAVTGGSVSVIGARADHLHTVCNSFIESGCTIKLYDDRIHLIAPPRVKRVKTIRSLVYPGFPTDAGPLLVASLLKAEGTSLFVETIFENRFNYIGELRKLGADIKLYNRVAVIEGVSRLHGATLYSTDLRGGAAMVVAALGSEGRSTVDRIYHIERGYESLDASLRTLGAQIRKE